MEERIIKTVSLYGLLAMSLYIAYLFYDKNKEISIISLVIVGVLIIYVVLSDMSLKKEKQDYDLDKHGTRRG